jgi:hypothetical protein
VGLRAGLDTRGDEKYLHPRRTNSDPIIVKPESYSQHSLSYAGSCECVCKIELIQDRVQFHALVNTMILRATINVGIY